MVRCGGPLANSVFGDVTVVARKSSTEEVLTPQELENRKHYQSGLLHFREPFLCVWQHTTEHSRAQAGQHEHVRSLSLMPLQSLLCDHPPNQGAAETMPKDHVSVQ